MEQVKWEVGAELPDWLPNPKPVVFDSYNSALKSLIEDLKHDRDDIGAGTEEYLEYNQATQEAKDYLADYKYDSIASPEKEFRFEIWMPNVPGNATMSSTPSGAGDTFIYWLCIAS